MNPREITDDEQVIVLLARELTSVTNERNLWRAQYHNDFDKKTPTDRGTEMTAEQQANLRHFLLQHPKLIQPILNLLDAILEQETEIARLQTLSPICGIMNAGGRFGEPLACAFPQAHGGAHSWASLPTFVNGIISTGASDPHPMEVQVEQYIESLRDKWSDEATDLQKTLVYGNLRGFAAFLKSEQPPTNA